MPVDIAALLATMTLEEKVAQLGSIGSRHLVENGRFSAEKARQYLARGIGHITRLGGELHLAPEEMATLANAVQSFLKENTRLGIPAIVHEECLSGLMVKGATTYPQAIGMAATWNPDLIGRMTGAIRREMRAMGAQHALAPVLDVQRDARFGRTEETFGEDQLLVARMALAYVRGLQGDDLQTGVAATLKHFAAHAASEGGRNAGPVHVAERELRDVFLYPFEVAVKEGKADSVMNAYHDIDGIPCAASHYLLTEILRQEWGFRGTVVSDYGAVERLRSQHFTAASDKEAAKQALEAGIDVELPNTRCYGQPLLEALREGLVSEATVDGAVRRVLRAKERLGLFENSQVEPARAGAGWDSPAQRGLAREMARQSIVLLKNDGVLPLHGVRSLAVIGPNAASTRNLMGDYAFTGHVADYDAVPIVSILEGMRGRAGRRVRVTHAEGCDITDGSRQGFAEAVAAASGADVAIIVVGGRSGLGPGATSGEGRDRADLGLPGVQEDLVRAVVAAGKPVVMVLVDGRPLAVEWAAENVQALVHAWLPGEEGGNAVADVLFGDYNPSGKTPVSFPRSVGQIPVHYSRHASALRDYIAMPSAPLFPFGHGLSYTTFEYADLQISPARADPDGLVQVSFVLRNTGSRDGVEVAQLYVHDRIASLARPVKELKDFQRVVLAAGQAQRVEFTLPVQALAFYNRDMQRLVEPGEFDILVGSSAEDIRLQGAFVV